MAKTPYTGKYPVVKTYLKKGDKGTQVKRLQEYLNWYTDGEFFKKCGPADGVYGSNTLKYAKKMQKAFFGAKEADGLVGQKTITKMKEYSNSFKTTTSSTTPVASVTGGYTGSYPTSDEIYTAQVNGICQCCKDQTSWSYDSEYKYQSNPTVAKSKTKSTCVTYVSCVLQRAGIFESGRVLWHDGGGFGTGKVYGQNNQMTVTYYNNKKSLKDLSLKTTDILFYDDNKSGEPGNGGHIEIFNGTIKSGSYYFYSGGCGSYHNTSNNHKESGSRKVLAVARIKARTYLRKGDRGEAVKKLQNYVNWYFDGAFFKECGAADGIYGDNTYKWVVKMQTDFFGAKEADGTIGPKTIEKMKAVVKNNSSSTSTPATPTVTPAASTQTKSMPTGIFNDFIDTLKIGQATSNEKGSLGGGKAGDQTGGEVSISTYGYSSSANSAYHWEYVLRAKDIKKRLIIADTCRKACANNHVGYDTNSGDRKTFYNEAKKVNWKVDKITTNCETTCSELANVCCAAAGLKNVGATAQANVETLRKKLTSTGEFSSIKLDKNELQPGDILISDCHTAIVVQSILNPGEYSQRTADLQTWLNWYYDGQVGAADGVYGPNTRKWCAKFQEEKIGKGTGDGVVGQKTLKAMKAIKK